MSARPLAGRVPPFAAEACATAPRRLGKYEVTGVIGGGAMGVVYRGVDPLLGRPVALKTIRRLPGDAGGADLSAALRFRNEAQAAARLQHPGIVSVYEYGEHGCDSFIAMEYVEGWPLTRCTWRGWRLPPADVASLMVQLLDALHAAHEQGVWHRDIKPANLLVTAGGCLKVTDFGIARIDSADLTQTTTAMGSPGYMAPERYTGDAPDRRVDVYACGVLLYELLAGRPPFVGPCDAVMYQVLHTDPPPPSAVGRPDPPPAPFDAVVARAMARRPDQRYATALEFRDALVRAHGGPVAPALSAESVQRLKGDAGPPAPAAREAAAASAAQAHAPSDAAVAAAAPVPLPAAAPGFDAATLAALESMLVRHLGPVAKLVVRREAARCGNAAGIGVLVARVAREALGPDDRRAFIAEASKAFGGRARAVAAAAPANDGAAPAGRPPQGEPPASPLPAGLLPVLGITPMGPKVRERAERVLAAHVGPIAKLMVASAARISTTREQFFGVLADLAGDAVDRDALLAELARRA